MEGYASLASSASCVSCDKALELRIELDEEDDEPMRGSSNSIQENYVDDDVHMQCGCHFHWSVKCDNLNVHVLMIIQAVSS